MKEFITKLRVMWLGAISVVGICLSLSVSASEYKPMIRYDRVWECRSIASDHSQGVNKCMKFDGTEEINGKTYHRIVTFKKAFPVTEIGGNIIGYEMEDCYEPEGYMREEDGKVYTLAVAYNPEEDYFSGNRYVPDFVESTNQPECVENLLYDFTLDQGDVYEGMTFVERDAIVESFKVLNISSVRIDGEECKMMYISRVDENNYDEPYYWYRPIVEGIGAVDRGCLNYHEFSSIPAKIWYWNYFLRLFDMEGNLLYSNDPTREYDGLDWGSFVSEVGAIESNEVIDETRYDILGRRITEPVSGQLYIQGGKKHIAK